MSRLTMTARVVRECPVEPLTLSAAKRWLNVDADNSEDDALIRGLIAGARRRCEMILNRPITLKTYEAVAPAWADMLILPVPPVRAIEWLRYVADTDGSVATLGNSGYDADLRSEPAVIQCAYGATWPSARARSDAVRVRFRAGMLAPVGVDEAGSPQGVLSLAGNWLAVGNEVTYYALEGIPFSGYNAGQSYTVVDAGSSFVRLGTPSLAEPSDDSIASHWLGSDFPAEVLVAMKHMLAHWYEHRESAVVGTISSDVPETAKALLWGHRHKGVW